MAANNWLYDSWSDKAFGVPISQNCTDNAISATDYLEKVHKWRDKCTDKAIRACFKNEVHW